MRDPNQPTSLQRGSHDMLTDSRPVLLKNARVIDPSRDHDAQSDVLIAGGKIQDTASRYCCVRCSRGNADH